MKGPVRDLLADRFDRHAEEIYRLYRAGIRATRRHQLRCPHCGVAHDYRVKDLDAARPWAVAWREIKFGKPAQQAQPPAKARVAGKLEELSMEELYKLAFQDEDEPVEEAAEEQDDVGVPLDPDSDTVIPSGED